MQPITLTFLLLMVLGLAAAPPPTAAADNGRPASTRCADDAALREPDSSTRRVSAIRESVYRTLSRAEEQLQEGAPEEARSLLTQALARGTSNGNETAQLHNMLAHVSLNAEDHSQAAVHLEQVVGLTGRVPEGLEMHALHTLAQLYFLDERYPNALACLSAWFARSDTPGSEPHVFKAKIHFRLDDLNAATAALERAIGIARDAGQPVQEDWWRLALYLYFEQERWARAMDVLETLVRDHGKREYWLQLAGLYARQGLEQRQVLALEAAHAGGFLTRPNDHVTYAQLLLQAEVPYRAALYLERAIAEGPVPADGDSLRLLSQAWSLSRDYPRAIDALERAVVESADPPLLLNLAMLNLSADRYADCSRHAARIPLAAADDPLSVLMLRATCRYHEDELEAALTLFEQTRARARRESDLRRVRVAGDWIRHLQAELTRRRALAP